ncbi:MAG: hypothetical protein HYV54_01840 [Parcubacteria group bacterium]|nr:hypothetical protein [Parcubacteria group bacterium]
MVEYANYVVFGNWERQTGSREYPLVGMQAAEQIYADPVELSHLLKVFRPGGGRLWNQEKVFPKPAERGAAVKAIVSALQELCR